MADADAKRTKTHQIKLIYFPFAGRAGCIRDALEMSGMAYENEYVQYAELAARKPSLPFGSLPVAEIDGVTLAQSNAILRWIGKQNGMYPTDDIKAAKVDEVLDLVEDLYTILVATFHITNEEEKLKARAELCAEGGKLHTKSQQLASLLERNGSTGFTVGDELTIGDLKLFHFVSKSADGSLDGIPKDVLTRHAATAKFLETVGKLRQERLPAAK